ncbi:hypothetical protein [Vibrio nigripulchritudo]|uniref:hypothetical protein n=1 Tax=Vibrio nigripulchritudo TaxID=28173 RepID=UPI0003B17EB6|nr:hypothetical protein [Vibrio nigripulchritudo]CCN72626.1 hypothetical protein VIBNISFn118_630016 [Vibrio nigripulchritudo SFn118]
MQSKDFGKQTIDSFFKCYIEWITELFPRLSHDHSMKNSEVDNMINHQYAIYENYLKERDIAKMLECNKFPEFFDYFLSKYCYRSLEIPLFIFPSTHPEDAFTELKLGLTKFNRYKLIPFAHDKSGTGIYCIDLIQNEGIVFYNYSETPSNIVRKKLLASSFLSLLSFLKEYLDWGGNLAGLEQEDLSEAVSDLRNVEKVIDLTWNEWWYPKLLTSGLES